MAAKDFGLIETDYSFFMAHATEAERDMMEYSRLIDRLHGLLKRPSGR